MLEKYHLKLGLNVDWSKIKIFIFFLFIGLFGSTQRGRFGSLHNHSVAGPVSASYITITQHTQ